MKPWTFAHVADMQPGRDQGSTAGKWPIWDYRVSTLN